MNAPPALNFDAPAPTRYMVIDCETSGLPPKGPQVPADHPTQPWLAHLAMIFLDHDLNIEGQSDFYVKPDGWRMPDEMLEINGLTERFLQEHGKPLRYVMDVYSAAILESRVVVAYNAAFDCRICRGSLRRSGHDDLFEQTRNICLMRAYKDWRKIFKGYKLADACLYLGVPYERHHRAPADALAAAGVFRALRERGAPIPAPEVHYHRDHDAIVARGAANASQV